MPAASLSRVGRRAYPIEAVHPRRDLRKVGGRGACPSKRTLVNRCAKAVKRVLLLSPICWTVSPQLDQNGRNMAAATGRVR